ncbi:50S ribosomal protein L25 [Candidatus Uhrbacteria bacterium]|nr:50S ribosomal protein L25 [Candidatus Uhrbacteria bacterium]
MTFALTATSRTERGRQAKQVRAKGRIPAIVYGHGIEPRALSLGVSDFRKIYRDAGKSTLLDLAVDGGQPLKVLIQDVQPNPLTLEPLHVDFRQVKMDEALTVDVPLSFINEAPAVKELAGTLVHALDTIQVRCLPADLPHEIRIDLSALKTFDDMITVADLPLPNGVTVLEEKDVVLASVTPPLSEDQLKKLEEGVTIDVAAVKTEADEKKAEKEAKAAEEEPAA